MIYPITFSIPKEKVIAFLPVKTKVVSSLIPGKPETYIYETEQDYYNEYRQSWFATTLKKAGWDCIRHYEILANGCIPYFPELELCPHNTLALFPKQLIFEGNRLYLKYKDKQINELGAVDLTELTILVNKLMKYTTSYLTTDKLATYILEKSRIPPVSKILYLSSDKKPDYLRCVTLHGFKELFGANCHDYPKIPHLYKSSVGFQHLYGKGITYTNLLDNELHDESLDKTIVEDIVHKKYDIIVYGSYHRGMPYYDLVSTMYKPNEIILLCGEDIHGCNCKDYSLKGHTVFVREMVDTFEHVRASVKDYWDGGYSKVVPGGHIETYLIDCLKDEDCSLMIANSDGIDSYETYMKFNKSLTRKNKIIGALCTRTFKQFENILLLPLDDNIFNKGLSAVLMNVPYPDWNSRIPKLFWRGGASGGYPSARTATVELLHNYEHADVKLTHWGNWEHDKPIPEDHFGDRCGLDKHFLYKYILILDGNIIASNHQWVFGSGAVPIMITHPLNAYWFKRYLKPMENYVPTNYDLSDLKEKIEWLKHNDDKAKTIMEEAMKLSKEIFTPEFQRQYIKDELACMLNRKTNVAFFVRHFLERGTEIAIYDYAHYNETILNNKSFIICFSPKKQSSLGFPLQRVSYDKFKARFPIIEISDINQISTIIQQNNLSFFHTLTHGRQDIYQFENKKIWGKCKTIKHCVFHTDYPESDYYVSIGAHLNQVNNTNVPVIPHIVSLPDVEGNLREQLKIPSDAIVIGRYGASSTFDINLAKEAIKEFVTKDTNTYFLFMNTDVFFEHPRILYLDKTIDDEYKVKFINTCDAMIHARAAGETFGLSIAEFSIKNKPIITCPCGDIEHVKILGDKAILYTSKEGLIDIFTNIKIIIHSKVDWNAYKLYTPEYVMNLFRAYVKL